MTNWDTAWRRRLVIVSGLLATHQESLGMAVGEEVDS